MSPTTRSAATGSRTPRTVGVVAVPLGDGRTAVVDLTQPERILSVSSGDLPAGATLDPKLTRLAVTRGVERWSLQPLNDSLIGIDQAVAADDAGLADLAGALIRKNLWALHYAIGVLGQRLAPTLGTELAHAVLVAMKHISKSHPLHRDLEDFNTALNTADVPDESGTDWDLQLFLETARLHQEEFADAMGAEGEGRTVTCQLLDLRLLPPRSVGTALIGRFGEVGITVEADDSTVTVSAPLGVSLDLERPPGLVFRVVDTGSGTIVAAAPAAIDPSAGTWVARFDATQVSPQTHLFELADLDSTIPSRTGEARGILTNIEGSTLQALTLDRIATATEALGSPGEVARLRTAAEGAVQRALDWCEEGHDIPGATDSAPGLQALLHRIRSGQQPPLWARPLLAELAQLSNLG